MKILFLPDQIDKEEAENTAKVAKENLGKHLFGFKAYEKRLAKDLLRAQKETKDNEKIVSFYLSVDYEFHDRKGKQMPMLVVGDMKGPWKNYIKKRVKTAKKTDAYGTFVFDDSQKENSGTTYLKLTIEKGNAKRNLIEKLFGKFLLPSGLEIKFDDSEIKDNEIKEIFVGNELIKDENPEVGVDKIIELYEWLDKYKKHHFKEKYFKAFKAPKYLKLRSKLQAALKKWLDKYEVLGEKNQEQFSEKNKKYGEIQIWLDDTDNLDNLDNLDEINETDNLDELKEQAPKSVISSDSKIDEELSLISKVTAAQKIKKAIILYNKTSALKEKRQLFKAIYSMSKSWLLYYSNLDEGHAEMAKLYDTYILPYAGGVNASLIKRQVEESTETISKTKTDIHSDSKDTITRSKTLYSETAGTQLSSELAMNVRDASIDDRAKRLANILWNPSNKSAAFGMVVKWLHDNVYDELEDKYIEAKEFLFNLQSPTILVVDILNSFGVGTLQTRYLLDKLRGEESHFASLAIALGLLGKHAKSSKERGDAMSIIEVGYTQKDIETILNATDTSTFEGAIKEAIDRNTGLKTQIEAYLKLLRAEDELSNDPKLKELKVIEEELKIKEKELIVKEKEKTKELNPKIDELKLEIDKLKLKANELKVIENKQKQKLIAQHSDYLCSHIDNLRQKAQHSSNISPSMSVDELTNDIIRLTKPLTKELREGLLKEDSSFMLKLKGLQKSTKYTGVKESNVAFIQSMIENMDKKYNNEKAGETLGKIGAIIDKQMKKGRLTRTLQGTGKELLNLIIESDNPELLKEFTISMTSKPNKVKETWEKAQNEDNEKVMKLLFEEAFNSLYTSLDFSNVSPSNISKIKATLLSNGAKGKIYHGLVDLASSKIVPNFGKKVLALVSQLEKDSKEYSLIRQETELLEVLQRRSLYPLKKKSDKNTWNTIASYLNLSKDLKQTKPKKKDTKAISKETIKKLSSKLITPKQLKEYEESSKQNSQEDLFWACRLSSAMINTKDEYQLLLVAFEAQKSGIDLLKVMAKLEKINETLYEKIFKAPTGVNNSFLKIKDAAYNDIKLTTKVVFKDTKKFLSRMVKSDKLENLVSIMTPEVIIQELFEPRTFESCKYNKENRQKKIKDFDIKKDFQIEIDKILNPAKALEFKKMIRFKLGDALISKTETPVQKLLVKDYNFTKEDLLNLGNRIKGISHIEKEKQLETGLQWDSFTSRMLQRDEKMSKYLSEGWDNNEKIPVLSLVINKEDLETEQELVFLNLQRAEIQLEEAQQRFEERKGEYDEKLKKYVACFMEATIFSLSMASGVGAAFGVVQLAWTLGAEMMKTTINQAVKMATEGDKESGIKEKVQDFFFTALADQVGVITGFVGANLTFALDVAALNNIMTDGIKNQNKKAVLKRVEKLLKAPALYTTQSYINGIFDNIGSRFVETAFNDEDFILKDPVDSFQSWGINQIKALPDLYLQKLVMTTLGVTIQPLADKLGWIGYHNPDSVNNQYETHTDKTTSSFEYDDARLGMFNFSAGGFSRWFNNWGQFDASPTFGGSKEWKSNTNVKVFEEAIAGLKEKTMWIALGNAFVWGSMDGSKGIKGYVLGLIDKKIDELKNYQEVNSNTEQIIKKELEKTIKELEDNIRKEYDKRREPEEKTSKVSLEKMLESLITDDIISEDSKIEEKEEFYEDAKIILNLTDIQMNVYKREPSINKAYNIAKLAIPYSKNPKEYNAIFADTDFLDKYKYASEDTHEKKYHPHTIKYKIKMGEELLECRESYDQKTGIFIIYEKYTNLVNINAQDIAFVFDVV